MDEIEKQILINQETILKLLVEGREFKNNELFSVSNRIKETEELLNPKEQSLPNKTGDALRGKRE